MISKNPILKWIDERFLLCLVILVFGILYMNIIPPTMVPDEPAHLYRAYEISQGSLVSAKNEYGVGGNIMPNGMEGDVREGATVDYTDGYFVGFANVSLYSPICYIPQALGVKIGASVTNKLSNLYMSARIGGFVFCMIFCVAAIYLAPFGRRLLFTILIFPMSMQELASCAPDGMLLAISAFYIAFIFRLIISEKKITKTQIAALAVASILLSMCKIVYLVFIAMIFLLKKDRFEKKIDLYLARIVIPVVCVAINLIWLRIASGYLIEFTEGVDSPAQVKFILTHIPTYIYIALRTAKVFGGEWFKMMAGYQLGWYEAQIPFAGWGILLVLFWVAAVFTSVPKKLARWSIFALSLLVGIAGAALIVTALYVQWTPLQLDFIIGIQGRYFTPLMFVVAPAISILMTMLIEKLSSQLVKKGKDSLVSSVDGVRGFFTRYGFIVFIIVAIVGNAVACTYAHSFFAGEGFY